MSESLPDYERHPLDEVVISVQFEPLKHFGVQQLFEYWFTIRDTYPKIEEQPILAHTVERPRIEPVSEPPKFFVPGPGAPIPMSRYWLQSDSGAELIQIQNDRFIRNWRLRDGNEAYPRFANLFGAFWCEWERFQQFLARANLGSTTVDQCDLTYVNYIEAGEIEGGLSGLGHAFSVLARPDNKKRFLPPPAIMKFEASYALPEIKGRLHVATVPNFRQRDFKLVINFTLSARGSPSAPVSNDSVKDWFMLAHDWIVRGFDELTTPEMHSHWGKKS